MMSEQYRELVTPGLPLLAEDSKTYHHLTERHLHALWFEQKYFDQLQTSCGQKIEIISPGIWNFEAGPDFQKAHLKIGNKEFRGDIEIHLTEKSWNHHEHHLDRRYDNVILHLCFWPTKNPVPCQTSKDIPLITAYLEPFLTVSLHQLIQLFDLDLYPYKKFLGSGRCAHELFANLDDEAAMRFFKGASEWRLEQKYAYLNTRTTDPHEHLSAGISMALGYKNNAEAFLELFLWLNRFGSLSEETALALAMQACGFFEPIYKERWGGSELYQHLYSLTPYSNSHRIALKLNQIRPLNHPIRRLVLLSKILSDPLQTQGFTELINCWNQEWELCNNVKSLRGLCDKLKELLPTYEDPYWNWHFTFESGVSQKYLPLLGEDLKNEILVNTIFPILYHYIKKAENPKEMLKFYELYKIVPASKTSKTEYLIHRFFGESPKAKLLSKAPIEQGAYQLHRDFCIHYEASCEGCPFVERYKKQFRI